MAGPLHTGTTERLRASRRSTRPVPNGTSSAGPLPEGPAAARPTCWQRIGTLSEDGRGAGTGFVGPPGLGMSALALEVALALDRTLVRVHIDTGSAERPVCGHETEPRCIIGGLREAGVNNAVFLLRGIERVG